ncbi:MAG: (2Fe-2S)-binding protein [bacterium]
MEISLTVNDKEYSRDVDETKNLLHFLREELGFISVKEGCGAGECGACTVRMDGEIVNSCLVLAVEADGSVIETAENESADGELSDLQKALHEHDAVQCGFCTPGMLVTIRDFLEDNPQPTEREIMEAIEGNLCRCTGYKQIAEAVLDYTGQLDQPRELTHARKNT